jgi:hypothetical protein
MRDESQEPLFSLGFFSRSTFHCGCYARTLFFFFFDRKDNKIKVSDGARVGKSGEQGRKGEKG